MGINYFADFIVEKLNEVRYSKYLVPEYVDMYFSVTRLSSFQCIIILIFERN